MMKIRMMRRRKFAFLFRVLKLNKTLWEFNLELFICSVYNTIVVCRLENPNFLKKGLFL